LMVQIALAMAGITVHATIYTTEDSITTQCLRIAERIGTKYVKAVI
jgi:hypothetical protein